jgi:mannan endo-1,4-beta-mannosidase
VTVDWPNHLIADGGEGFDDEPSLYPGLETSSVVSGDEGTSFHTLAEAPEIDLVSYHLYPESWKLTDEQATQYIDAHESIARAAGKVAYMGEFGLLTGDGFRAQTYEQWLDRLFMANGGSLGLVWQLTYSGRPDNDGFALVPGQSAQAMAALARQAQLLAAPGLDGVSLALVRR